MADSILALEEVVAGYGGFTVLNGTSLGAARGAITTLIGPNGAGKSTVFKTVFGLLPARSGRVLFDGREVTNFSPRRLLESAVPDRGAHAGPGGCQPGEIAFPGRGESRPAPAHTRVEPARWTAALRGTSGRPEQDTHRDRRRRRGAGQSVR